MTVIETKNVLQDLVDKLKKSITREISVLKELDDDKATYNYIENLEKNEQPLPNKCAYANFEEWKSQIIKEINTGNSSLEKINLQKEEIKALEYYIANAPEEEEA